MFLGCYDACFVRLYKGHGLLLVPVQALKLGYYDPVLRGIELI